MKLNVDLRQMLDPKRLALPPTPKVCEIRVEPYEEWSDGQDALRVRVILDEATEDAKRSWKALKPIDEAIRDTLLAADIDLFPYIEFFKVSELAPDV